MIVSKSPGSPKKSTSLAKGLFLILFVAVLCLALKIDLKNTIQVIHPEKISGPIVNPLMGWAPWATIKESHQPHSLVYADLTWQSLEPQEGIYDFNTFEREQQLARWRKEGKRIIFRFVLDKPGDESHLDIPDWLFEKINGSGDFYDNEYGMGFSPDYSNLVLIDYHQKAMKALGERYGRDSFFAFIELGSLGHWGEWHTHPQIMPLPSETIRTAYVYQYKEAFPETELLMRRPFSIAKQLGLGLYNDMTGDLLQTTIWLDWIKNGGPFLPTDINGLAPMSNGWQTAPVGGEQSPVLPNERMYGDDLEQTLELLKKSHTTFIGPNGPYNIPLGNPLQEGIDKTLTTLGYRIYICDVQMPQKIRYGKSAAVTLTFSNDGIAPIYYNWPASLYLFDESGNILSTHEMPMDIRKVLPDEKYSVTVHVPIDNRENGKYSIGIAILDPLTNQPAVRLANKNKRSDLIQYIGAFEIKRFFELPFTLIKGW